MNSIREALIQYCEVREEVKDLRRRIDKLLQEIDNITIVSDSVKGTKRDGTYGNINITGYPFPEFYRKNALLKQRLQKTATLENDLLELANIVDDFIAQIPKSELRLIFRLYYLDNLSWVQVSHRMNRIFPNRPIAYSEDSLQKKHERYLKKIEKCPSMSG